MHQVFQIKMVFSDSDTSMILEKKTQQKYINKHYVEDHRICFHIPFFFY